MCDLINAHTCTHTQKVALIPPWEDRFEWYIMTKMKGPDYVVMRNSINTHTHTEINARGKE